MKRLLLFTLLLLCVGLAFADTFIIGTGTSTQNYIPFYGFYDYSWTKTIFTAAEINTAGLNAAENITGIGYYVGNTPSNWEILDQRIYVRHTTAAVYETTDNTYPDNTAFTQVFQGNLTFNGGGWRYIAFSTVFPWNGTDNIEILWENWDGDYSSGYPNFRYTSTSTNYMSVYKYADTTFPSALTGTRTYNRPNIALVTPQVDPPNPAVLVYPADAGWAFLDASLSWQDGGGMPTGYDVYFGTTTPPPLVAEGHTSTSYTPTLAANTTYYWQVVPYNANGDATACPIWSFSTPTATQIAESFDDTTFPPLGWTTPGGAFTRSTTTPFYGAASAYESIAAGPSYLHTSMLQLTATSELDWWMRTAATTGIGRVQIVYSTDGTTWNDIGAEIVMPTATTWMNYNVDLSSLAGNNYMIGFKVYSSTTSSASFYIDHVFGPELAALVPDPAVLIYPADAGWAFMDATLQWNASASGGIPTSYDVYFGTTTPPSFVQNQAETTYTPTLAANTTYYWQIVPRNDTGPALDCPIWSFSTPTALQLAESFEVVTPFLPVGWANPGTWSGSTTSPFHGARVAYKSASTTPAILSTPILAITATSTLDFYYRTASTTGYGLMNIKYSDDRVTWNQIGPTISMPTTTTWNHASVDLSTLAGNNYYLAFEVFTSTSTSSIYLDHVFGPELAQVAPGPVALTAPADLAAGVNEYPTFTWTAPTLGGVPTGYRVYCDTNADPVTMIADVTGLTYTAAAALNWNTTYYWKVVAYNGGGDSVDNIVRSFTVREDPTIYTLPWLEDFGTTGTTFPPLNWARYSGLLTPEPVALAPVTGYWVQDDFANIVTDPTNKSARLNIYSTTYKHWLMTPPIQMPGAGYQLEFDIALTDYANAAPPDDPAGYSGVDDKFIILIGDGTSWSEANILRKYDNAGSPYVYNDVSHLGDHVILSLDDYTGVKYIAFYGESTVSNADNDFFVDNVMIRQTPAGAPDHVTLVSPANEATGLDPDNVTLTWTQALTGGNPAYYGIFVSADPIDPVLGEFGEYYYETTDNYLNLSAQVNIELDYSTTWYWAVLPYNDEDLSPDPEDGAFMIWRFTTAQDPTITVLPHEEYFDDVTAPALPWGWSSVVEATTTAAYVNTYSSTTYAVSPPNSARLYNSSDVAANLMLITPDFSMPLNTIKVRFYARSSTAGETLLIGAFNPADSTFTEIGSVTGLTTTQTQYTVPLSSYTGTDAFIAFKHGVGTSTRTIYIDNVEFIEMMPNDLAATAISGPGILEAGNSYDFTVGVYNEGTASQSAYTVNLMEGANVLATLNVSDPLAPGDSADHVLSWTPATGGVFQLYGKVVLAGDGNAANDETAPMEVYVLDSTMTVIPVGDDATTTSGYYLPLTMYYKNSVSEELYFTDELHLQSGTIAAIVYKNTFLTNLLAKPVKIWMAHTTVTDLTGGWLPGVDYTLVFDGTVDFPSGINYIVIPLDTPFAYTGGTLATRVNRPLDTSYYSSSDKFYYTTTPDHTNRSRYVYSDTVVYDPLAPSATGTALGYVPNTMFVVQNAVLETAAELEGYVYESGTTTPIPGATVTLTDERYSTTTDDNGYYNFQFWEPHTVTGTASKYGFYDDTVTGIALTMGNTVTQNFQLAPYPRVIVSGIVTSNDYPAGLEGAEINLYGTVNYQGTSGTDGSFSIADVIGTTTGVAYTVTVSKDGYEAYTGNVTVYETNVNLGTINLTEYLWTPYNLVATPEGENARLVWEPAAEPDYLFFDFEADNGGWVGSASWGDLAGDWEWTNNYPAGGTFNWTESPASCIPPAAAHSGTGLWGTKLYTNYTNSGGWSYLAKTVDLAGFDSPQLRFWRWNNLFGDWDYYQVRVNGTILMTENVLNNAWAEKVVDLSAYANQTVEIQFAMYATSVVAYAGLYIDDVYVGPATRYVASEFGTRNRDRWFLNYDVYRLLPADEAIPDNWTMLASAYADTTYLDTGFATVPGGVYEWAVKANYSGALASEAIFSNTLGKVYQPQDIDAMLVGADVVLSWTAEPGATYYKVYAADDPFAAVWTFLGNAATNTYTIVAPAEDMKFFKVTAIANETLPAKGRLDK